jgi:membrane-associated phospholipid phosphatase
VLWLAAFVTYWGYPAAPPWLAAQWGHLPPVARTIPVMWTNSGIHVARELVGLTVHYTDPVAAIPSLHAATPLLICLVCWRYGRAVRVLSTAYVIAMGFTLVYVGEHYVVDLVIGWAYAVVVYVVLERVRMRVAARRRRAVALAPPPAPQPVGEPGYAVVDAPRGVETNAAR